MSAGQASAAERQRGEALNHCIDHLRRAIAALEAAAEGADPFRRSGLLEAHERLLGLLRALQILA